MSPSILNLPSSTCSNITFQLPIFVLIARGIPPYYRQKILFGLQWCVQVSILRTPPTDSVQAFLASLGRAYFLRVGSCLLSRSYPSCRVQRTRLRSIVQKTISMQGSPPLRGRCAFRCIPCLCLCAVSLHGEGLGPRCSVLTKAPCLFPAVCHRAPSRPRRAAEPAARQSQHDVEPGGGGRCGACGGGGSAQGGAGQDPARLPQGQWRGHHGGVVAIMEAARDQCRSEPHHGSDQCRSEPHHGGVVAPQTRAVDTQGFRRLAAS
jgi:hypothetical protein